MGDGAKVSEMTVLTPALSSKERGKRSLRLWKYLLWAGERLYSVAWCCARRRGLRSAKSLTIQSVQLRRAGVEDPQ